MNKQRSSDHSIVAVASICSILTFFTGCAMSETSAPNAHRSFQLVRSFSLPFVPRAVAVEPYGETVALIGDNAAQGDYGERIVVENLNNLSSPYSLQPAPNQMAASGAIAFSRDGRLLAAGSAALRIWRTSDWKRLVDVEPPANIKNPQLQSISFSQAGDEVFTIISGHSSKSGLAKPVTVITAYSLNRSAYQYEIEAHPHSSTSYAIYSPIVLASQWGAITFRTDYQITDLIPQSQGFEEYAYAELHQETTGQLTKLWSAVHSQKVIAAAISPVEPLLATSTTTGSRTQQAPGRLGGGGGTLINNDKIKLWDLPEGNLVQQLGPLHGAPRALTFVGSGRVVIACMSDSLSNSSLTAWNTRSGSVIAEQKLASGLNDLCLLSSDALGKAIVRVSGATLYHFTLAE